MASLVPSVRWKKARWSEWSYIILTIVTSRAFPVELYRIGWRSCDWLFECMLVVSRINWIRQYLYYMYMSQGTTILIIYTGEERCRLNNGDHNSGSGTDSSSVGNSRLLRWRVIPFSQKRQICKEVFEVLSPRTFDSVLIKIFFRVRVYQDFFHKDA